jgi:hypothetical protein
MISWLRKITSPGSPFVEYLRTRRGAQSFALIAAAIVFLVFVVLHWLFSSALYLPPAVL